MKDVTTAHQVETLDLDDRENVRAALLLALVITLASCASSGASRSDGTPPIKPPEIIGRDFPDLGNVPFDRTSSELTVMVDPDGTADMSTLRIMGNPSAAMRDAFTRWIARTRFKPATQGGVPVRGEFQLKAKTRVEVRRVG